MYLKFEQEFQELKEKFENQASELKSLKIEKITLDGEANSLKRDLELKNVRVQALEKRVQNIETGRARLEVQQEQDAFQGEELKAQVKEMQRQLISQDEEM